MSPVGATPTPPEERAAVQYAGFWRRFVASLLDGLILGVVFTIISFIFGAGMFGMMNGRTDYNSPEAVAVMTRALSGLFMFILVEVALSWLYFAFLESSKNQGTLGKMALGLRVTDLDGRRLSFGRATGRYFAKILSSLTLMIGYIMAGFTQKKQALHDFVAGTLVLSKQSTVPAQVAQNAYSGS